MIPPLLRAMSRSFLCVTFFTFSAFSGASSVSAQTAIPLRLSITPLNAGGVVVSTTGGVTTAYYPTATPTSPTFLDGVTQFDSTATALTTSRINYRVSADLPVPSPGYAWVLMARPTSSGGTQVVQAPIEAITAPFPNAASGSFPTVLPSNNRYYAFQLLAAGTGQTGITFDFGFYPTLVCAEPITGPTGSSATISGCNGAAASLTTAMTMTFIVTQLAVASPANVAGTVTIQNIQAASATTGTSSASATYGIKYAATQIDDFSALTSTGSATNLANCTSSILSSVYLPRNEAIDVDGSVFPTHTLTDATNQAPLSNLMVVAKLAGTADASSTYASNSIVATLPWRGKGTVRGFQNSSLNVSNEYQVRFMVKDAAGYVSPLKSSTCAVTDCCLAGVKTADIETFLKTNKCFIATAVYGDENAVPVQLLRKFRNRVLLKNQWGQAFTRFYYQHSPAAAEWLERHPYVRFGVKMILSPIVGIAWLMTPEDAGAAESTSISPYLDQLKRTMPKEDDESTESYIEELKKKAKPDPYGSESYSERLKRTAPKDDAEESGSYTERLRAGMKADDGDSKSAIQSVMDGKSQLRQKRQGSPTSAAGFRVGAGMDHDIRLKDGRSDFQSIYGNGMHPDVRFFYEYQFLKDRYVGTLGLGVGAGLTYFSKLGKYSTSITNPVTGSTFPAESNVKLSFYAVPTNAFLTYRLHPLKYVVPYVYGGPSALFYYERRSDGRDGKRGYSLGAAWGVGAAFQLNWMFPSMTWDLYSSSGVHLLYLTAEYSQAKTSNTDVSFDFRGYSAGLTYEF